MAVDETTQCLDTLIKEIQQELSVACMLPMNIPQKEILRIIGKAKSWFYKRYEDSVEEKFFLIHSSSWEGEEFKQTKTVELPSRIYSVNAVHEIGREHLSGLSWNSVDPDFATEKFIYSDSYSSIGIQTEGLVNYVISEQWYDLAKQILINKISYTYNRLNHKFRFLGEVPTNHTVLEVYQTIDDCSLFSDEIFIRYVAAQCKIQLSRVLGTFTYSLPGNIEINYDLIRTEGTDELEEIKTEIKEDEGADFFLTS